MKFLAVVMLFLTTSPVLALTCKNDYAGTSGCATNSVAAGDCETLGYAAADVEGCEHYLYCPFDSSYKRCVKSTGKLCSELGFSQTDKSKWCANIIACESDTSYTLCEMQKQRCIIGDVFYADGSCGNVDAYDGKKTPIGVVFYVDETLYSGKIVNLKDLKTDENYNFHPESPYEGTNNMPFGLDETKGGTVAFNTDSSLYSALNRNDPELYKGKSNTKKLASITNFQHSYQKCDNPGTSSYNRYCQATAALAAQHFYPTEEVKNHKKFGSGNWYLPAIGELVQLYGVDRNDVLIGAGYSNSIVKDGPTKTLVDKTLSQLGTKGVEAQKLTILNTYDMRSMYISSTETTPTLADGKTPAYGVWILNWHSSILQSNISRSGGGLYMRAIAEY